MNTHESPALPPREPNRDRLGAPVPGAPVPELTAGVFELKFRLTSERFDKLLTWARGAMGPDPLAETRGSDTYLVNSLYFDTRGLDVYHQSPGYRMSKYRARRYGQEPWIYLEEKQKKRGFVRKRRTAIPDRDLSWLAFDASSPTFAGEWFRERLRAKALAPTCRVAYERVARVGGGVDAPYRLTLDRRVVSAAAEGLELAELDRSRARPIDVHILELKYAGAFPPVFRELMDEHDLEPAVFSKYRSSVERQELDGARPRRPRESPKD